MPAGLTVVIALLAQAAAGGDRNAAGAAPPAVAHHQPYGPVVPAAPKPAAKPAAEAARCVTPQPGANPNEIVICAQGPRGYRLDPDVMEAKREIRSGGPAKRPENFKYNPCASVGPMGCMGQGTPGIDLVNAAVLLAEMAKRAVSGGNVGQMFVTDPQKTEYQYYVEAKHRREAKEAEVAAAAAAKAKAASAPAAPGPAPTATTTPSP